MKVCSVIVTYGDRFHLLKQVIDACLREGIDKIIVVDNASVENSRKQLQELEKKLDKLEVIYFDENKGSAGGYKAGLKRAYECEECEYIWLLDDDNEPQKNSLRVLKGFWKKYENDNKEENLCLLSYRPDRVAYKEAIMTQNPNLVLGRKNSFLGFHIIDLPIKVARVIKRKIGIKTFKENPNIKSGQVSVAPYGGMFFHKKLIDKIGYPKEEYFVYADDHEWSYRITKNGGKIILLLDSLVEDIDTSWNIKSSTQIPFINYLFYGTDFRVYYAIRNRTYFEINSLVNNRLIYFINKFLFVNILISINFFSRKSKDRMKIIKSAVTDSKNKKLGVYL